MKRLTFRPIDETLDVRTESRLLDALLAKRLSVLMACGGNGLCATCHVHVRAGADQLSTRTDREKRTLSFIGGTDDTSRLACQTRVRGEGVVVELPKGMFIEKAEDLLSLLGTRAPDVVLHPILGTVLIAKGKIITRSQLEALRGLKVEVHQLRHPGVPLPTPPVESLALPQRTSAADALQLNQLSAETPPLVAPPTIPKPPSHGGTPRPGSVDPTGFEVGALLGKCLLIERIGQGGSGVVFRALHRSLNIAVAVKVLHIEADDGDRYEKFRAEAQLLAQLNHPNIVRIWDFEEEGHRPYLVMEHVEGLSLAELIDQSGRLLADRAASVMVQVADALAAAWRVGIVHRDVKPGNILLARDGTAKLADLGLAMMVADERGSDAPGAVETPEGTVAYMSPEQARASSRVDYRADMYSLGATFYHAVTGRLPFPGRTRMEVMFKHAKEDPPPPHQLVADLAPSVSQVILRMLAKRPEDRHPTYDSLRSDLLRLFEETDRLGSAVSAEATASDFGSTSAGSGRSLWKVLLSSFSRKKVAGGSPSP